MSELLPWVQEIVETCFPGPYLEIGMETTHPVTGRRVKIVGGEYWGDHGISNFWYWRRIKKDGTLFKKLEHGYGWRPTGEDTCQD